MLKKYMGFLALSSIVLLSGCNNAVDSKPKYVEKESDILDKHGEIENKERFDQFLKNVQQGKEDTIRIVHYTKEGDAILHDYEFKNKVIHVTQDNSHDNYGDTEITKTTCKKIKENKDSGKTSYTLMGCTSPKAIDTEVLTVE